MQYPSGRTLATTFDAAARAATLTGSNQGNSSPYVTGILYAPHGAPCQMTLNNGNLVEQTYFNNRLQPTVIRQRTQAGGCPAASGSSASDDLAYLSLQYYNTDSTKNNGNVWKQGEVFGGLAFTTSYTYDGVNRLQQAVESGPDGGWTQTYGYDAVGNRWVTDYPNLGGSGSFVPGSASSFDSNSRILVNGSQFDNGNSNGPGNLTMMGGYTYSYDGENRMVSSHLNSTTTYVYDGEGRRVQKTYAGTTTTEYVYDAAGKLAAEYTLAGTAPASPCVTCYVMADHLGSTRMVTDAALSSGSMQVRAFHDYLPFGEEVQSGTGSWDGRSNLWGIADAPKQRFTGKERDESWESGGPGGGLDYFGARYFSAAQGRFASPDPVFFQAEMLADPQRFNLYAYVRNTPESLVDPSGERIELVGTPEERQSEFAALQQAVGGGAAAQQLSIVEENGRFYVDVDNIVTFGKSSAVAADFVPMLLKGTEVTKLELATQYQDLELIDPATNKPRHLSDQRANGIAGRDPSGQLHLYLDKNCCSGEPAEKFDVQGGISNTMANLRYLAWRLWSGVPTNSAYVLGHEAGHIRYMMGHYGADFNETDSNAKAVNLENKVRQTRDPGSPVRIVH